ncbi:sensor histidine kinase [Nocardiopsis ansamitocini]|uniref:histidine kinase n=1 Tax=Nocardiopsis ansamitocini TaxID=1670832 RepID=A0A9W6P8A4_9ACTN|nr:histidine kinase [Nocardiopsis ansamitocini]GLU48894.1 hypothetical protein Nans01_32450 [Nocardiopsis ansamitocini]
MVWRWMQRTAAPWKWGRTHRYRVADVCWAIGFFPFVMLGMAGGFGSTLGNGILTFSLFAGDSGSVLPRLLVVTYALILLLVLPTAVAVTIMLRRSRPIWLLALSLALLLLFGNFVPLSIAIYSYAVWSADRFRLVSWAIAYFLALVVVYWEQPFGTTLFTVSFSLVLPLVLGLWVGTRRQLVDNLRDRAARLEREQNLKAETAIAAERTRIAREMHDVVAHRVSLMVLHAGGLEVSAGDDATVRTAGLIRTTGREALAELREILGVLRDDQTAGAPTAPQPMLSDLAKLINDSRAAGVEVRWRTTGTPRPLAAQLERTAYRVVQEALTNVAKHAPNSPASLRLDYGSCDLEVVVVNDPPSTGAKESPPSSGYGLAGLRERVTLAGGTLAAGPHPDGAWQVRAVLPLVEAARAEGPSTGEQP